MNKHPLSELLIRSGVVRAPDLGFILACDPKLEESEIEHTIVFKWKAGAFNQGRAKFSAHSSCILEDPQYGVLNMSGPGIYSLETRNGVTTGNVFRDSQPARKEQRYGDIRSVAEIDGKAYAVGLRGTAYRLDELKMWTRIDEGLPATFNIQAIHGFDASDICAVGRRGQVWHFRGSNWTKWEMPTNALLTSVKCAGDRAIYIGGHGGILIRGNENRWKIIEHGETTDDIWDLEWFEGELYVSTMSSVYRLRGENLEPVDFGADPPKTTYQLSAAKGVLWSIGRSDVMSFDSETWTRIV